MALFKYLKPLGNTLLLAVLTALIVTPIGVLFAWLVARTDLRWKNGIGFAITLPIFISPLIGALAWIALAAPSSGLINAWVGRAIFGMRGNLVDIYSFPAIIFVMSLFYIPLCHLLTVGAFSRLDGALVGGGPCCRLPGRLERVALRHVPSHDADDHLRGTDGLHPGRRAIRCSGSAWRARQIRHHSGPALSKVFLIKVTSFRLARSRPSRPNWWP